MLVRGPSLSATMSRYLVDRITATPNIEVRTGTEITRLHGSAAGGLEAVTCRQGGVERSEPWHHLFVFAGAEPETEWLQGSGIEVDRNRFVVTGAASGAERGASLESCLPGVFAVGDVRCGSVKRVGGAIGEGATVVAQIHRHLEARVHAAH
jgi:thioredoxin reductase (NADPH)